MTLANDQAALAAAKQLYDSISAHPSSYDSNRLQFAPSFQQIQDNYFRLSTLVDSETPSVSQTVSTKTTADTATSALSTQSSSANSPTVSSISGSLQKIFSGNAGILLAIAVILVVVGVVKL